MVCGEKVEKGKVRKDSFAFSLTFPAEANFGSCDNFLIKMSSSLPPPPPRPRASRNKKKFETTSILQTYYMVSQKKRTFRIAGKSAAFRAAGQSPVTRPGFDPRLLIDGNSESAFFGTPCIFINLLSCLP